MAMATSLKNMDPPMQCPPWPAGFPRSIGSPEILPQQPTLDRPGRQAKKREVAEQEPRYETRDPPYPSGGHAQSVPAIFLAVARCSGLQMSVSKETSRKLTCIKSRHIAVHSRREACKLASKRDTRMMG